MRPLNYLITAVILMLFLFGCDGIQNPHQKIEDIVERIPDVELIPGTENTTLTVKRDGVYSYFRVTVQNVERNPRIANGMYYAWCLQMNVPINAGEEYTGVKLYSTERDTWMNRVSYIVNNRARYEQSNPGLSWKEIQVAMWVMLETRSYQLERLADRLPSSVDGYNPEYVQNILQDVKQNGHDFKPGPGDKSIIITNDEGGPKQNNGIEPFECGDDIEFTYRGQEVIYGTVLSNDRCWLDRNLGASQVATSSTDAAAYGDLFQWGRLDDGHQDRSSFTTTTLSNSDKPEHSNFILAPNDPWDWRNPQNPNLWQGGDDDNNPCPVGFRLPTEAEWEAERLSWSPNNNAAGAFASPLKLPMAGARLNFNGGPFAVGLSGFYWSSTVAGTQSRYLHFSSTDEETGMGDSFRANGISVRCIQTAPPP